MSTLSLRLLGGFHIERNGQPLIGFATNKVRALITYLAIERERPHQRGSLSALLWPDQDDERARQSLRQALSNLKQILGSDEFLLISPSDIQLSPQADILTDVGALERLIQDCKQHRHRTLESCLPCMHRFQKLIDLYKGDFLAGFPYQNSDIYEDWVTMTRERLHQHAMQARITLANMAERTGDLPSALLHVREQIRSEPWREEAHRQAMRLYFLSGERSKALLQYQQCKQSLQIELEVAPTPETNNLYDSIQNEPIPRPLTPPHYIKSNSTFIGRTREQAEIAERLADPDCHLVTILGMGGIGKSRLAMQVAQSHSGLYKDGIFFVPLAEASDVPSSIASALGFNAPEAALHLAELIRGQELLLVLDNFEHMVDTNHMLSDLLAVAPGLQIIITSRERLRLREEWIYTLEGLPYPKENDELNSRSWDSIELFEKRAGQIDSRLELTGDCLASVAEICRLVEGQPLAIELAASALAEQSCYQISVSLRQSYDSLVPTLRNFPKRHYSLRAVFEHSWEMLTTDEQTCLTKLSVFAGGFSADAARKVAGANKALLALLMSKSLIRSDRRGRFSLHSSIREYAAEKLSGIESTHSRHADYYANLALTFEHISSIEGLDLLQEERANLRAAWEWSLQQDSLLSVKLLTGLSRLFSLRGPFTEGEALFLEALQKMSRASSAYELNARISIELAKIYNYQARYAEAIELMRSVNGSPGVQARIFLTLGQALDAQGVSEAARPILESALALARDMDDKQIEADSLRELGNAANRLVEYESAISLYKRSLMLSWELGDKRGESSTLNNWGGVEWDLGKLDTARKLYLEALAIYRALGNLLGEAKALNNLSNVFADQGDLGASLKYSEQALLIHQAMGNPRGQSAVLNNLGATYFGLGQYGASRQSYLRALAFHRESGNSQAEAETLANLSLLDCIEGCLSSGIENARRAIVLAENTGDRINLANAYYYLGRNLLAGGDYYAANEALDRAQELRQQIPHPGRQVEIQTELALTAQLQGESAAALELVSPLVEQISTPSAVDGTDDPCRIFLLISQILSANGDKRADQVWLTGKALTKERAGKINDPCQRQAFLDFAYGICKFFTTSASPTINTSSLIDTFADTRRCYQITSFPNVIVIEDVNESKNAPMEWHDFPVPPGMRLDLPMCCQPDHPE